MCDAELRRRPGARAGLRAEQWARRGRELRGAVCAGRRNRLRRVGVPCFRVPYFDVPCFADRLGFWSRAQALDEGFDQGWLALGSSERGGRREGAEDGVDGEFFDGQFGGSGAGLTARLIAVLGEVGGSDLEAVEEEAGAARVHVVEGDAAEDLADGELDGGAVFGVREIEGGAAGAALFGAGDGLAGGVVEVAEGFAAEAGRAAAAAVGVDVAAALALGLGGGCGHAVVGSPIGSCAKYSFDWS